MYSAWICFFLTVFLARAASAQWSIVAPNLLGAQEIETGAISHQSGVTWAASLKSIFMSPDSGQTWVNRSPIGLGKNDNIDDIRFYDQKTGVACTNSGSVYRTDDQGLTWHEIHNANGGSGFTFSATFLGSADNIIVTSGPGGNSGAVIDVTRDGGMSWKTQRQANGTSVPQIRPLLGGGAVALLGTLGSGLSAIRTNDYGTTWQQMPGSVPFDSYSFDVNPCEPNTLYVSCEKGTNGNAVAEIDVSNDGGVSWHVSQSYPINRQASQLYLSGSIVLTPKAAFAQTVGDGIIRSTDQGATWKKLGGPSATFDTRLLCAINSNIVIAADNNGTIYRTVNSGGDSLQGTSAFESLSLTPEILFATDTLARCDSPVTDLLHLNGILCKHLKIVGEKIQGVDPSDYSILKSIGDSVTGNDSVRIAFRPNGSGSRNGDYVITLEDSTQLSIPLLGFGKGITNVAPLTHDINVDTIGGFAQVPIRFNGFIQKEDVDLVLNYDARMIYVGSFALDGQPLDLPGESWSGRAKIRIPNNQLQLDTITGSAIFTVFPDGTDCFTMSVDSMTILSPVASCTYVVGNPVTATICPPRGCGIMTLTDYMRHGIMPTLSITPNPNRGEVHISSSLSLGLTDIKVIDVLGRICCVVSLELSETNPERIYLRNLHEGSYYLDIRARGLFYHIPILVLH